MNANCDVLALPAGTKSIALTVDGGGAPTAAGATSLTVTPALATGVYIPAGTKLTARNASGSEVLLTVTADVAETATAIPVEATPGIIQDQAIIELPPRFGGRTDASLNINANLVNSQRFEEGGWATQGIGSFNADISANGDLLQLDPVQQMLLSQAFDDPDDNGALYSALYAWLYLPVPSGYTSGTTFQGQVVASAQPISLPSDGIITYNVTLNFSGRPIYTAPAI